MTAVKRSNRHDTGRRRRRALVRRKDGTSNASARRKPRAPRPLPSPAPDPGVDEPGRVMPWMRAISEAAFQRMVVARAQFHGWWAWHCFDSRRTTPGLPDLILIRSGTDAKPGRVIFAELKSQR